MSSSLSLSLLVYGLQPTCREENKDERSNVSGTVDFAKEKTGLLIRIYAQNLSPGPHGIHAHEKGDCAAEDASSAGEHFNPAQQKHGGPQSGRRHLGDFGNIEVPVKKSTAPIEIRIANPATGGAAWDSLVGRAVVIKGPGPTPD